MNKKLSVAFKKLQKHQKKQSKKTKIWQTKEKKIEITVNIKRKQIWTLINNASDISYMNSHLQKELKIKKKERKQSLIVRDTKWNKIDRIMKKIKKIKMQIIKHQERIMFSKMKMLKHKIMLEMNWLRKHNLRINWKQKMIMMKNCEYKIR